MYKVPVSKENDAYMRIYVHICGDCRTLVDDRLCSGGPLLGLAGIVGVRGTILVQSVEGPLCLSIGTACAYVWRAQMFL